MADYIDIDYSKALHEAAQETKGYVKELLEADNKIEEAKRRIVGGGDALGKRSGDSFAAELKRLENEISRAISDINNKIAAGKYRIAYDKILEPTTKIKDSGLKDQIDKYLQHDLKMALDSLPKEFLAGKSLGVDKLNDQLDSVNQSLQTIAVNIEKLNSGEGFSGLAASLSEVRDSLAGIAVNLEDIRSDFSNTDFKIDLGGNSDEQKKLLDTEALNRYTDAWQSLMDIILEFNKGGFPGAKFNEFGDSSKVLGLLYGTNKKTDVASSLSNYRELIDQLKQLAEFQGIDISGWSQKFEQAAQQAYDKIVNFKSAAEEALKGTTIGADMTISSPLGNSMSNETETVKKSVEDEINSIKLLIVKIEEAQKAIENKTEAFVKEREAVESEVKKEMDVIQSLIGKINEVRAGYSGISVPLQTPNAETSSKSEIAEIKEETEAVKDLNQAKTELHETESAVAESSDVENTNANASATQAATESAKANSDAMQEESAAAESAASNFAKMADEAINATKAQEEFNNAKKEPGTEIITQEVSRQSDEWNKATDAASKYHDLINNIAKIVRTELNGDVWYTITDTMGNVKRIDTEGNILRADDIINVKKAYDDVEKSLNRILILSEKVSKGTATPRDISDLENERVNLVNLEQNLSAIENTGLTIGEKRNNIDRIKIANAETLIDLEDKIVQKEAEANQRSIDAIEEKRAVSEAAANARADADAKRQAAAINKSLESDYAEQQKQQAELDKAHAAAIEENAKRDAEAYKQRIAIIKEYAKEQSSLNNLQAKAAKSKDSDDYSERIKVQLSRVQEAAQKAKQALDEIVANKNAPRGQYFEAEKIFDAAKSGDLKSVAGLIDAISKSERKASEEAVNFANKLRALKGQTTKVENSYTGTSRPVKDEQDLLELEEKRSAIIERINELKVNGGTKQDLEDLKLLINEYKILADRKRDLNNPPTGALGSKDLDTKINDTLKGYSDLIAKSGKYYNLTEDITNELKAQKEYLESNRTTDAYVAANKYLNDTKAKLGEIKNEYGDIYKLIPKMEGMLKATYADGSQKYTESFKSEITNILDTLKAGNIDASGIKAIGDQISDLFSLAKNPENLTATQSNIDSLVKSFNKFKEAEIPKSLIEDYNNLKSTIDNLEAGKTTKGDLQSLRSEIKKFGDSIDEVNAKSTSFLGGLSASIKKLGDNVVTRYLSLYRVIGYLKQAVNAVKELDTALTELRKVSDASTSRLEETFARSTKTAKELGSTIKDVINVTADWARLGYNVDEAEELARATTLFKNVGDDLSADDASSYMISTLKGFKMEASESIDIVDKYNEVIVRCPLISKVKIRIGCDCTCFLFSNCWEALKPICLMGVERQKKVIGWYMVRKSA